MTARPGLLEREGAWSAAALLGVIALAYANSLASPFQFDDYQVIVGNPAVHDLRSLAGSLSGGIRPLLRSAECLCWLAGGGAPWPFHVLNLIVHALNALLVAALGLRLFESGGVPEASARRAAWIAAAVFALHPVNTEAVTYLSGGSVALATLFQLAALWFYDRHLAHGRCADWALALGCLVCALATRETSATLPGLLMLWESLSVRARDPLRVRVLRIAPFWLLLAAAALLALQRGYAAFFATSLEARTPWDNALTQIHAYGWLLKQFFLLAPLDLDPDLPVRHAPDAASVLQALLLVALLASALALRGRARWAAFCAAWGVLGFLPTNSLLPRLDVANDRQWYLPGIALCWTLGWLAAALLARARRPALVLVASGLLALAALTALRNADYRSELALWRQTLAQSPHKPRALNNYGVALRLAGRETEARAAFLGALAYDPRFTPAQQNLAVPSR
ncbi:MAG: hypothetical protein IRZ06_12765 [Nevskia sp.]|nr:hypothetical protein [Nevskia sp.]